MLISYNKHLRLHKSTILYFCVTPFIRNESKELLTKTVVNHASGWLGKEGGSHYHFLRIFYNNSFPFYPTKNCRIYLDSPNLLNARTTNALNIKYQLISIGWSAL